MNGCKWGEAMIKLLAILSALVAFAAADEAVSLIILCAWAIIFVASLMRSTRAARKHDIHADDFYF